MMDVLSGVSLYAKVMRRKRPCPIGVIKDRQCELGTVSMVGVRERIRLQSQFI